MSRTKLLLALLATALVALTVLTGFSSSKQAFRGTVYLGMDTPLTRGWRMSMATGSSTLSIRPSGTPGCAWLPLD